MVRNVDWRKSVVRDSDTGIPVQGIPVDDVPVQGVWAQRIAAQGKKRKS